MGELPDEAREREARKLAARAFVLIALLGGLLFPAQADAPTVGPANVPTGTVGCGSDCTVFNHEAPQTLEKPL